MINADYMRNRHSCYYLKYHLVVVTKYRHSVLENKDLNASLIAMTERLFTQDWNCRIDCINTDKDHIHVLFTAPPQVQLSKLINNFKGVTSRLLRKEYADYLSNYYWKPYFWSNSYFIGTVSDVTEQIVAKYIRDQGQNDKN